MHTLLWFLALAVFVLALLGGLRPKIDPARAKGIDGERRVAKILVAFGAKGLNDIYLPSRSGTTQIDHVYRIGNAILVVETKNMAGTIYGTAEDVKWRQSFGRKESRSFLNPIKQNTIHVNAVRRIVGEEAAIRSLVVMAGKAKFPKGMPEGVIAIHQLMGHLRTIRAGSGTYAPVEAHWTKLTAVVRAQDRKTARGDHMRTVERRALSKCDRFIPLDRTVPAEKGRVEPWL